jgi:hypothetical protein
MARYNAVVKTLDASALSSTSVAKIPDFSKHWASLFTHDTIGLMIHALLAFVSILASAFRRRQGVALENLALRPFVRCMYSSRWRTTGVAYCALT